MIFKDVHLLFNIQSSFYLGAWHSGWSICGAIHEGESQWIQGNMQDGIILQDSYTLKKMDWLEEFACVNWPSLYFIDISTYPKIQKADGLYHRLSPCSSFVATGPFFHNPLLTWEWEQPVSCENKMGNIYIFFIIRYI